MNLTPGPKTPLEQAQRRTEDSLLMRKKPEAETL